MQTEFTPFTFETSTPEDVGIETAAIAEFEAKLRENKLGHQGYMFYRHGKLAASSISSPYRFTDKRHVYSVSKSWTSTTVGIAVDEGLISVEDRIVDFFPELLPETVSENLAAMKIKHLLTMNSGHQNDTLGRVASCEPGWAKRFLSLPVENAPGTHFAYNSTGTYMLSAIITKVTGMRMADYLTTRLFNPLGIENVTWEESPEGINDGGWGIHVSPEDMLKLGVLYLNKGVWNGRRILSEDWVDAASSFQVENGNNPNSDWGVGYGYQFWRCRHNCFRADGAFGQYIIVSPDTDSVAVMISEERDMGKIAEIYWDTVLASMEKHSEPLPPDFAKYDTAAQAFMLPPVYAGGYIAPMKFTLPENKLNLSGISLRSAGEALVIKLYSDNVHAVELICGGGKWEYSHISHCPLVPAEFIGELAVGIPAEIAAAWGSDGGNIHISMQFVSTPHGLKFEFDLKNGVLTVLRTLDRGEKPVILQLVKN